MSKSNPAEQIVERPRQVERDRCRARAGATRHREAGADGQHGRPAVAAGAIAAPAPVEQSLGTLAGGVDQAARLAHASAWARRRGDDHARWPRSASSSEVRSTNSLISLR